MLLAASNQTHQNRRQCIPNCHAASAYHPASATEFQWSRTIVVRGVGGKKLREIQGAYRYPPLFFSSNLSNIHPCVHHPAHIERHFPFILVMIMRMRQMCLHPKLLQSVELEKGRWWWDRRWVRLLRCVFNWMVGWWSILWVQKHPTPCQRGIWRCFWSWKKRFPPSRCLRWRAPPAPTRKFTLCRV